MYPPPYLDHVKKLVTVYFNKYGKRLMKEKNPAKTIGLVHFYLALLQNNSIPYDLKPEVRLALETVINLDANRAFKIELAKKLEQELKGSLSQSDENISFAYLIFCGQAIIGSYNFNEETKDFIKGTFHEYLVLNIKLINMAKHYTLEAKEHLFLMYPCAYSVTNC
jgi:hypothetical protein